MSRTSQNESLTDKVNGPCQKELLPDNLNALETLKASIQNELLLNSVNTPSLNKMLADSLNASSQNESRYVKYNKSAKGKTRHQKAKEVRYKARNKYSATDKGKIV